jgi:Sulfotransferase family
VAQGRRVFLHHVTGWPRARLLWAAFAEARFVHVVRDGWAVASSWLQSSWWTGYQGPSRWYLGRCPSPMLPSGRLPRAPWCSSPGLGWKLLVDAFEQARAAIPATQWLEVRYEDVLADPRGQVTAMLEFLGLEWTPTSEAGFARYAFASGRREAFRHDLDPDQLALLNNSLAAHLQCHGYAVLGPGMQC